jgi:hypothetical protein
MKSLLMKAVISLVALMSCSGANAAITRYESTDTSSLIFGAYDYDDVLNTFSNVNLKVNSSVLDGPSEYDLTITTNSYGINATANFVAPGSSLSSFYSFITTFVVMINPLYPELPISPVIMSQFDRFEYFLGSGGAGPYTTLIDPDNVKTFSFTPRVIAVSNVPEPEIIILLALCPLAFLARKREQQKQ